MKTKDRAHLAAVAFQGVAVFVVGLGISLKYPATAEAVMMSGGVMVLANAWFAWTVRKIKEPRRILVLHFVRFVLYGLGVALVIAWRDLDALTCVVTMFAAHLVYVFASFINGLVEEEKARESTK